MATYAVTDWVSTVDTPTAVAAAMETYLETLDDAKVLYIKKMVPAGGLAVQGVIIHTA